MHAISIVAGELLYHAAATIIFGFALLGIADMSGIALNHVGAFVGGFVIAAIYGSVQRAKERLD